jgi:uncharacterized protein
MADQKIIRKTYEAVETKASEGEDRTLVVTISTSNPDRSKDVVVPDGMQSDNYLRNPVVAAFHRYDQPAIGRTLSLQKSEGRITAKVEFLPKGIYPLADQLYEMYKAGFMNAWSIGFIPKKKTDLDPQNPFFGGSQFDEWELLEYSAVLVPDNPEALTMLRSKGIDEETLKAAQHVEPEADPDKVKRAIEQASKTLEQPDSKPSEPKDSEKVAAVQDIIVDHAAKTITIVKTDESRTTLPMTDQCSEGIKAITTPTPPTEKSQDTPDDRQFVPVIRALKQADKYIGIALRDYKKSQPEN